MIDIHDNCLVFLPSPAREALGLAGNLEEHADGEKELWFGRFLRTSHRTE